MKALLLIAVALVASAGAWLVVSADQAISPKRAVSSSEASSDPVAPVGSRVPIVELATVPDSPVSRVPVKAAEPVKVEYAEDPCKSVTEENERLSKEVAYLTKQIHLLQSYDGLSPYEYFLQSPDADVITDPAQRKWLRTVMGDECPFYLYPGEAIYLVEHREDEGGYDSFEEMMIRFLGQDRVLREAPPGWLDRIAGRFLEEDWQSIINAPLPNR